MFHPKRKENLGKPGAIYFPRLRRLFNEHREEYYPNNIGPRYFGCYKLSRKTVGLKEGRREEKSQKKWRERERERRWPKPCAERVVRVVT